MEKIHFIKETKRTLNSLVLQFALQGFLLIVLGVLVLRFPELLIIIFSLIFILLGLGAFWLAYKVRKFKRHFDKFFDLF